MMTLFTWAAEKTRTEKARALRLAPHGQVRRLRWAFVWATAEALKVEK